MHVNLLKILVIAWIVIPAHSVPFPLRWKFSPGETLELRKASETRISYPGGQEERTVLHRVYLETRSERPDGYELAGYFSSHVREGIGKPGRLEEAEHYRSAFIMSPTGFMTVAPDLYMPNVRNIPAFPSELTLRTPEEQGTKQTEESLQRGDVWITDGEEIMKFDRVFRVPMKVENTYLGRELLETNGERRYFHKIKTSYELRHNFPPGPAIRPEKAFGIVAAVWLWDERDNIPYIAKEDYKLILRYASGEVAEFNINSRSEYRKIRRVSDKEFARVRQDLSGLLPDDAKITEESADVLSLELGDVLFETGSAKLNSDARETLKKAAEVLTGYPELSFDVHGHTDSRGADDKNQKLSEERASEVAAYLLKLMPERQDQIAYRGFGASRPKAGNDTAAGRASNRRVEIKIRR